MNQFVITYALNLIITTCLTIWVAWTLFKNGNVFLVDIFSWQHGTCRTA